MNELAEVVVDGLAAYRGARLVVLDKIGDPLRQWWFRRWPSPGWLLDPNEEPVRPGVFPPRLGTWRLGVWNKVTKQVDPPQPGVYRPTQWHSPKGTRLGEGFGCLWCVSVWWAIAITAARHPVLLLRPHRFVARVLASAGVAAVVIDHVERRSVMPH